MNYIHALLLSIVEGITEFLPISSTGHLILTANLLQIPESAFLKSFEVFIQLGAILAVAILYKNELIQNRKLWRSIFIAFIPTGITGLLFYKFIKELLGNELITVLMLFMGGIIIILIEKFFNNKKSSITEINELTLKKAFIIGIFQSLSVVPGVSRAASTIIGARILGMNRETAVIFSFLLAVPTMLAATVFDLSKNSFNFNTNEYGLLLTGFTGSFIIAYITIKFFLKYIQRNTFTVFGIYRIFLAFIYWLFVLN